MGEKLIEQIGAGYPNPLVFVSVGQCVRDVEPMLARQALGIGIPKRGVGPLRFPRAKIRHPSGGIGDATNGGIRLVHLSKLEDQLERSLSVKSAPPGQII
jgi:hypothetical protein